MITDITKIDKNFKVETKIQKEDLKFYNPLFEPFAIYGLMFSGEFYHRMPLDIAKATSEGVNGLNLHTAGGRIRFKTTSAYVAINAKYLYAGSGKMAHFTTVGASGYDMYLVEDGKAVYFKSFIPQYNFGTEFESIVEFPDNSERDIIIHFPLYNTAKDLYIGLQESATVSPGSKYKYEKPVVYYGSSITQGGCASRPGNTYENMVSRYFDTNFLNLGFSGSCKAEDAMIEYIPTLDMSIFVYDYDHNAPSAEHLAATHEKLFKAFRQKQPDTPVIIMTMTDIPRTPGAVTNTQNRFNVIRKTYENAIAAGDKNVYFINGQDVFKLAGYADCTVDGCHPNDLGFYCMSQAVIKVIEENDLLK